MLLLPAIKRRFLFKDKRGIAEQQEELFQVLVLAPLADLAAVPLLDRMVKTEAEAK